MTIGNKLNVMTSSIQDITRALNDKGVDTAGVPLSGYPALIADLNIDGGFEIGKISYNKTNDQEPGWLVCDGSRVSVEGYPELVEILGKDTDGYATLPDLPTRTQLGTTFTPMIKAEDI